MKYQSSHQKYSQEKLFMGTHWTESWLHDSLIDVPLVLKIFASLLTTKCFVGKITGKELIPVANFIPGTFQKYVNNDGTTVDGLEIFADGLRKVETFVHYT